jgi:Acyl-protein synthetase, LuxE
VHQAHDAVLQYIATNDADFDALALAVFTHQFDCIPPYRRYCERLRKSPHSVSTWREIPPVPVLAFKQVDLCCGPPERIFLTTGTTRGSVQRGRHLVPDLRLYRASAVAGLRRFLFPDIDRMQVLSLLSSAAVVPESSLAQMVAWAIEEFGDDPVEASTQASVYAAGPDGIDYGRCVDALRTSERTGMLLCVMSTTTALLHLLDYCQQRGLTFRLPHGCRLMDTGGSKGAPRTLSRKGLLQAIWSTFAIPGYFCVNEYGMSELSSQFYENAISSRVAGRFEHRHLVAPPWTRVRVLDPATLEEVMLGEPGLLCFYDLANAGTALAVLTEDIGRAVTGGFVVDGRLAGAESRGCSLGAAEWGSA